MILSWAVVLLTISLQVMQGGIGMPTMWASGVQGVFDYLVIDLLGPSLDNLYRQNNKIMDLRSVLSIGMQVVSYHFFAS